MIRRDWKPFRRSHFVFEVISALLLTEASFLFHGNIPFTRPRLPGRTSLSLTLAVFLFSLPAFLESVLWLEMLTESKPWVLTLVVVGTVVALLSLNRFRRTDLGKPADDPFADEIDTEIMGTQLVFLSRHPYVKSGQLAIWEQSICWKARVG